METEIILNKLDELGTEVKEMRRHLRDVSDKVTELENDPGKVKTDEGNKDQSDTKSKTRGFSNIHYGLDSESDNIHYGHRPPNPEDLDLSSLDIQGEFRCIQDANSRVVLPPEIKLSIQHSGIKSEDRPKLRSLSRCAQFSETALKILSDNAPMTADKRAQLITILTAQQEYLKGEYTNILVKNTFNTETASFFQHLQTNTSAFPAGAIANIQTAATLAAASQPLQSSSNYRSNYRGRTRGQGRSSYGRNQYQRGRQDYSQSYSSSNRSNVPSYPQSNPSPPQE